MLDKAKKNVRQKKFEEYLESLPEREKREILSKIEVNKLFSQKQEKERKERRRQLKERRRQVTEFLEKRGFHLTYFWVGDYKVALAYYLHKEPSEFIRVECWYTICSPLDMFSRPQARSNLVERIRRDHMEFSFDFYLNRSVDRLSHVAMIAQRRFEEEVLRQEEHVNPQVPHELVRVARERMFVSVGKQSSDPLSEAIPDALLFLSRQLMAICSSVAVQLSTVGNIHGCKKKK